MVETLQMAQDGRARFCLDAGDQALPTPWNDQVNRSLQSAQDEANGCAIVGSHGLDAGIWQAGCGKTLCHGARLDSEVRGQAL